MFFYKNLNHEINILPRCSLTGAREHQDFYYLTGVTTPNAILVINGHHLGVRIENDVLITPTGNKVITSGVPKERADIEKLMKDRGRFN